MSNIGTLSKITRLQEVPAPAPVPVPAPAEHCQLGLFWLFLAKVLVKTRGLRRAS